MNHTLYKSFIVIILALMLTPVLLFQDQESMMKARGVKRYDSCFEMNHRTMIQRCMNYVYEARQERCDAFPVEELRQSCLENVKDELAYSKQEKASSLAFSFKSYWPVLKWAMLGLILLVLFKGPFADRVPGYKQLIQSLPRSEFLASQTLKSLVICLFCVCLLILVFLELAFMLNI